MEYIKDVDTNVNKIMKDITRPELIKGLLHLVLVMYASNLAPPLPSFIVPLLGNQYFRLLIFSLILWTSQFSPSTAILISITFVVVLNLANKKPAWEFLENTISTSKTEKALSSQIANTPIVTSVERSGNSIIVKPTIIDTPSGQKVINPNVIISPAVVSDSSGQKVLINPTVSSVGLVPSLTDAIKPIPQAIDAVKTLSVLASSPSPANAKIVAGIVDTALKAVTTNEGSKAVVNLANQAITPGSGSSLEIKKNVETAVKNIVDTTPPSSSGPPASTQVPLPSQAPKVSNVPAPAPSPASVQVAVSAVNELSKLAGSPVPAKQSEVLPIVKAATDVIKTKEGTDAIIQLANQAISPSAAEKSDIKKVADTAVKEIKKEGCYPLRKYDISKVSGYMTNTISDYGDWKVGPNPSLT